MAHFPFHAGSETDFDGERYLFAGQANLTEELRRQDVAEGQHGGLKIIDMKTMQLVGKLDCPGTDNHARYLDPEVYNTSQGTREFVALAHHGNLCTRDLLEPRIRGGFSVARAAGPASHWRGAGPTGYRTVMPPSGTGQRP